MSHVRKIVDSRASLPLPALPAAKPEAEGGCGVIGVASTVPVEGKYLLQSLLQMKNRGNGKGGGIAAVGLVPDQLGVSREVLDQDYLLEIAYLDSSARNEVEAEFIESAFLVDHSFKHPTVKDYRSEGLEVKPPDVYTYFCRVRPEVLEEFRKNNHLQDVDRSTVEDEFVYQNTYRLNVRFYSSLGEKKAFVLSHGKNMMVLKLVGYGDQVVRYYKLEDFKANIWIGHHRYPTKGRVWHPGGAHPFVGLHEALVHNGDFANYHSMMEYLAQRNIHPLFLTDTEVSVLLFDLLSRVYRYPLEYLIEAMAPTTERDFEMLPDEKKKTYRAIQTAHIHGSPDGPWFFIVARNDPSKGLQLLGITDTSMLRPQVFALQEGRVRIGVIASERQAINAMLRGLQADGKLPSSYADIYWNARGGSHTDGGAFGFTVRDSGFGKQLICTDKFGQELSMETGQVHFYREQATVPVNSSVALQIQRLRGSSDPVALFEYLRPVLREGEYGFIAEIIEEMRRLSKSVDGARSFTLEALTLLFDRIYDTGTKKRGSILQLLDEALGETFSSIPILNGVSLCSRLDWQNRKQLRPPSSSDQRLVIDGLDFPVEGDDSVARFAVEAYQHGWKRLVLYNLRGHRFIGNGLGPRTNDLRIDCYGDVGDYVASGIDGAEVNIHGAAQDQAAQIMNYGRLIVHGDVGQAFMYAAKGGQVYVMGNAAGRPLINAVGKPKVVINGTCLDYLAESFMAGDPSNGGGFVIVNGLRPTHDGRWVEQPTPYPGSNLFSLASGGAIFVRDPHRIVTSDQLNGGRLTSLSEKDWNVIIPHLQENERLFGISVVKDLLTVNGREQSSLEVYRKIEPIPLQELS
jgi:glutamate synthase domain-containing protein 1/glutamate synthase domain-containing protein 3